MKCQRRKFLLTRKDAYLNCAYMSPMMKKAENAGKKGMAKKRKPHHISVDDFFHESETIRSLFSSLINCPDPNRIVIVPSVSYGLANVVHNIDLKKGQNIVVAGDQFPSNIYPWMRLCQRHEAHLRIVKAPDTPHSRGIKWNEEIQQSIDENTAAVAISQVHWADGTLFDLVSLRQLCTSNNALLIIDGTQSVGAMPFDLQQIQPDALICAAYKWLMGPYSIGLAYYGPAFDEGIPIEENWINRHQSDDFANLVNYQQEYRPGALRYEVGEHSNFILVPMLHQALKQLNYWGADNIQQYCKSLIQKPMISLGEMGLEIENDANRSAHLFGIKCPADKITAMQASLKKHRVSVSFRGNFVRVSPHVYNDEKDMQKLVNAFQQVFGKKS